MAMIMKNRKPYGGGPVLEDKVESGNMNAVTSNAVAEKFSTYLDDMFIVRKVSATKQTLNGNSFIYGSVDCSYSGYTPIGVVGHDHLGFAGVAIFDDFLNGNTWRYGLGNYLSAPGSAIPNALILYMKE